MSSGRWHGSAGLARERLRLRVSLHVFQHHLAAWGQVQEGRERGAWWVEQVGLRGGAAGLQMLGLGLKLQGWHMWSPAHLPFSQVSWSLGSWGRGQAGPQLLVVCATFGFLCSLVRGDRWLLAPFRLSQ